MKKEMSYQYADIRPNLRDALPLYSSRRRGNGVGGISLGVWGLFNNWNVTYAYFMVRYIDSFAFFIHLVY